MKEEISERAKKFQEFNKAKYLVERDNSNEENKDPEIGVHPDFVQIPEAKVAVDNLSIVLDKYDINDEK